MDDIEWKDVFSGAVYDILLHEFLGDVLFIVEEERIELVGHCFRLLMQRDRLGDIFVGKDIGLAHSYPTDHHLIVILIFLR